MTPVLAFCSCREVRFTLTGVVHMFARQVVSITLHTYTLFALNTLKENYFNMNTVNVKDLSYGVFYNESKYGLSCVCKLGPGQV